MRKSKWTHKFTNSFTFTPFICFRTVVIDVTSLISESLVSEGNFKFTTSDNYVISGEYINVTIDFTFLWVEESLTLQVNIHLRRVKDMKSMTKILSIQWMEDSLTLLVVIFLRWVERIWDQSRKYFVLGE